MASAKIIPRKFPTPMSARPYWAGTVKFIQRKLCRRLSAKFKFHEIKALYSNLKKRVIFGLAFFVFLAVSTIP